jgi:uncharacterized protein
VSSRLYSLPNGRTATDCPLCGQATAVDRHGDRHVFRCFGGHTDTEIVGALDPAVLLELAAATNGKASPDTGWLEGDPMDPTAVAAEPLPTLAGFPFMHPATAAVVSGPTGAGRSSLVQACAYDAACDRLRVAYLGSEVTLPEFNARAADLAARRGHSADGKLRAHLARVRYLNLARVIAQAWNHPSEWREAIVARYDVVAIDPLSAVASALNLDFDKSNADFVRFYDRLIQPLVDGGRAVVMLENIGHAAEARSRAKGASAKQDRADLTFSCALRSNPTGLLITARKVRTVRAAFSRGDRWLFDRDSQRVTRQAFAPEDDLWRPTILMERVSRLLEDDGPLGRNEIRSRAGSKAEHVDAAIKALVHDNHVAVQPHGQKKLHHLLKPFRDPGPTESQLGPGPGQETGSHRVPPPVGGTRNRTRTATRVRRPTESRLRTGRARPPHREGSTGRAAPLRRQGRSAPAMTWQIRIPFNDRSEPLGAAAFDELPRYLSHPDEQRVTRYLLLQAWLDGLKTVGDVLDRLEESTPESRRRLLNVARLEAGLPTTEQVEQREAVEQAQQLARGRAAKSSPWQLCHADGCNAIPMNELGVPVASMAVKYWCPRHRHLAGEGDLQERQLPWTISPLWRDRRAGEHRRSGTRAGRARTPREGAPGAAARARTGSSRSKTFAVDTVDVDQELGQFEAIVSAWDVDREQDVIRPDAFDKTIAAWRGSGKNLPLLFEHSTEEIGAIDPHSMRPTAAGLLVAGAVDRTTDNGKQVWRQIKRGTAGFSIGYMAKSRARGGGGRVLVEIDLLEVSATSKPMHPAARALSWKSAGRGLDLERVRNEAYESMIRALTDLGEDEAVRRKSGEPIEIASLEC